MCGRYQLQATEEFYKRFSIVNKLEVKTSYNIAPSQLEPVVLQHSPNHVEFMYWGFIPFWEEKKEKPHALINVRDDSIKTKPWAHKYVQFQRCLIPATGYYEWKKTTDGKIPYHFHVKGEDYISFAGMFSETANQKGEKVRSYTIITTSANELTGKVHNRMPVILDKEEEEFWLNPDNVEVDSLVKLLKPFPANKMEMYPVSSAVNNPSNNDKSIIEPIKHEDKSHSSHATPDSK